MRQELADITRLSFPTVSKLTQELIDENVVRENGKTASSGGRRCDLLEINPDAGDILAVSITENGLQLLLKNGMQNYEQPQIFWN